MTNAACNTACAKDLLNKVLEVISGLVDRDRVAAARRRHAAALRQDRSEYLPLLVGAKVPALAGLADFDWKQRWYDPDCSLYMQLKNVAGALAASGDSLAGVRADTGVINCMTIFGVDYAVPEHTKPIVTGYAPKEALRDFQVPADVSKLGIMPRVVEHMQHHQAVLRQAGLDDVIAVFHCDLQGPFDVAAQARGHDLFLDLYEDPDFAHAMLDKATDAVIAVGTLCKKVSGEPMDGGLAVNYWMTNGGVRLCGDSDILISAEQFREFVLPRHSRAFAAFGGGWLHYCGGARGFNRHEGLHLHELYAQVDGLRGLNWTTARDAWAEMRRLKGLGLVHLGGAWRGADQDLESYLHSVLEVYSDRRGVILSPELRPGEGPRAVELWRRLQDQMLPRA